MVSPSVARGIGLTPNWFGWTLETTERLRRQEPANTFGGRLWGPSGEDRKVSESPAADDADAGPVTDHVHEGSWSANLELERHADRERVLADAVSAVEHTAPGVHVNLVTHADHGHPETYLYDALAEAFGDDISWAFVDQCGCGGYVTRVHVDG